MKFLKEVWHRFSLPTGSFFQVIQTISIICATLAGIPLLIIQFEAELHTHLPEWVHAISSRVVFFSSAVAWIIAKLPVKQSEVNKPSVIQKLPFTDKTS